MIANICKIVHTFTSLVPRLLPPRSGLVHTIYTLGGEGPGDETMHSLASSEFTVKYCLTTADVLSWHLDCSTCKSLSLCESLFLCVARFPSLRRRVAGHRYVRVNS